VCRGSVHRGPAELCASASGPRRCRREARTTSGGKQGAPLSIERGAEALRPRMRARGPPQRCRRREAPWRRARRRAACRLGAAAAADADVQRFPTASGMRSGQAERGEAPARKGERRGGHGLVRQVFCRESEARPGLRIPHHQERKYKGAATASIRLPLPEASFAVCVGAPSTRAMHARVGERAVAGVEHRWNRFLAQSRRAAFRSERPAQRAGPRSCLSACVRHHLPRPAAAGRSLARERAVPPTNGAAPRRAAGAKAPALAKLSRARAPIESNPLERCAEEARDPRLGVGECPRRALRPRELDVLLWIIHATAR
jgi:hypothetical protein